MAVVGEKHLMFITECKISNDESLVLYGQFSKDETLINEFMRKIKSCSDSLALVESVEVGNKCLAMFSEDNQWYRAIVMNVSASNCIVEFMDYGNVQSTRIHDLRRLPPDFASLNRLCHELVLKTEGGPVCGKWTSNVVDIITEKYLYTELEVEIFKSATGTWTAKSPAISKTLLDNGLIKADVSSSPKVEKICTEAYSVRQKIDIAISTVLQDGSFYCYNCHNEKLLSRLCDDLYNACTKPNAIRLAAPSVGQYCCAPCRADKNWYRAEILQIDGNTAKVRFIDYGNTDICHVSSLVALDNEFYSLPMQGIHCLLSADMAPDKKDKILQDLVDKPVTLEFMSMQMKPYPVRLYHEGNVIGLSRQSSIKVNPSSPGLQQFYKKLEVQLHTVKTVIINGVESLNDVGCILADHQQQVKEIIIRTQEVCSKVYGAVSDIDLGNISCGSAIVVIDSKHQWHRSKVISVVGNNTFKIVQVDTGRSDVVPTKQIRAIPKSLLEWPDYSVRFSLVKATTSCGNAVPPQQLSYIFENSKSNVFYAVFQNYDKQNNLYMAELRDIDRGHEAASFCKYGVGAVEVPLNSEIPIRITCVEDPDHIWVQLIDYQANLIRLTGSLNTFYNGLHYDSLQLCGAEQGQLCCIKSTKTHSWCRGEIVYNHRDTIGIQLIDYGYSEAIQASDIKTLMPEFKSLPRLAFCCQLYNTTPSAGKWCNGSVRYLREFVAKSGVTALFVKVRQRQYQTKIYVSSKEDKICLNEQLVDKDYAAWMNSGNSNMLLQPAVNRFYDSAGANLVGAQVLVSVCPDATPDVFWSLPFSTKLQRTYSKLGNEMSCYLGSKPETFPELYQGMPCIHLTESDAVRAAVISFADRNLPNIFLVDFGEKKTVPIESLRHIREEHIHLVYPLAIKCTLRGIVEPNAGSWSPEAQKVFSSFCQEFKKGIVCSIHGCITDGKSELFMVRLSSPFKELADVLEESSNCSRVSPLGKLTQPYSLKSYLYSNLGPSMGKDDMFYVTHIERADLFYCQLVRNFRAIDEFMDKVQEHCRAHQQNQITVEDLTVTPMCFVKYVDGKWYRAHFICVTPDFTPTYVSVFLVDYGNVITVLLKDVIVNNQKCSLALMPMQAIPCSLSEIVRQMSDIAKADSILTMMKKIILHQQLPGIVTGSTNGKLHLDLFADISRKRRINSVITADILPAVSIPPCYSPPLEDLETIVEGEYEKEDITPKSCHTVTITSVNDPHDFYVRLEIHDEMFKKCSDEVDGLYMAMRCQDCEATDLRSCDIVCVKHPTMLRWCRGLVIDTETTRKDQVMIEFVDFGEKRLVSVSDSVKKMTRKMMQWPKLAVHCQLRNVRPNCEKWTDANKQYFANMCESAHCRLRFSTLDMTKCKWSVDLKINGKNVSHTMVEDGQAKLISPPSSVCTMECIKTKPLEPWQLHTTKQIYISHIESLDEIYIQLVETQDALDAMMERIEGLSGSCKSVVNPEEKCSYLARYEEDDRLYRVNTLAVNANGKVNVIYSDYGNFATLRDKDLFLLPREHCELPEQATRCKILYPSTANRELVLCKLEEIAADESVSLYACCIETMVDSMIVELTIQSQDGCKTKFTDMLTTPVAQQVSVETKIGYQNMALEFGVKSKVYVAQVDGPEKVWIQFSLNAAALDMLMDEIAAFYSVEESNECLQKIEPGMPCVSKYYVDDSWYRGEIIEFKLGEKQAIVHFVDYGNSESVKITDIFNINEKYLALPKQAIACRLQNVEGFSNWDSSDTEKFVERVTDVELDATLYHWNGSRDVYLVELIYPCGKSLNEEWNETLKSREIAQDASGASGDHETLQKENAEYSAKHVVTDRGDHVIVENLVPAPKLDFDTITDHNVSTNVHLEHCIKQLDIEQGDTEEGYVSYCEHLGRFYIQLSKLSSDLDKITEQVASESICGSSDMVQIGDFCIAKSPDDGEWYRAKFVEKKHDQCVIYFVDYGNTSYLSSSDIKVISSQLKSFAAQAIECRLHDLEPCDSSQDATDSFLDITMDKELKIEFIEFCEPGIWSVKLLLTEESKDVTDSLLDKHKEVLSRVKVTETEVTTIEVDPESTTEANEVTSACIPSVMVTDTDQQNEEVKLWSEKRLDDLQKFYAEGYEIFQGCPAVFKSILKELDNVKKLVLSSLGEKDWKVIDTEICPCDRSKRLNDIDQQLEQSPAKKMKLDLGQAQKSNELSHMFVVGDTFEGVISAIMNPAKIFVRPFLVMSESNVGQMKNTDVERTKKILKNSYCLARRSDAVSKVRHWVRAEVMEIKPDSFALVDLDVGTMFEATAKYIFPIGEDLLSWPSFCMQCSLTGIKPNRTKGCDGGWTDCDGEWTDSATIELINIVQNLNVSDSVEVSIVDICNMLGSEKRIYTVEIYVNKESLAKRLVDLQVAIPAEENCDKENLTHLAEVPMNELDRGSSRKAFRDLTFQFGVQNQPRVITPESSKSIGQFLPNFDLIAVPWNMVRTSIKGSELESVSDSVFISDAEESFAVSTANPAQGGKKQLAVFKIYCSTITSSVGSGDEPTLAADIIEKDLLESDSKVMRASDMASPINTSLLDILSPVDEEKEQNITAENQDGCSGNAVHSDEKEKMLNQVAANLVMGVFHAIEEEEEEEDVPVKEEIAHCSIIDSLDVSQSQKDAAKESNLSSNHQKDNLGEGCQESDEDNRADTGCTMPDSLAGKTICGKAETNTASDVMENTNKEVEQDFECVDSGDLRAEVACDEDSSSDHSSCTCGSATEQIEEIANHVVVNGNNESAESSTDYSKALENLVASALQPDMDDSTNNFEENENAENLKISQENVQTEILRDADENFDHPANPDKASPEGAVNENNLLGEISEQVLNLEVSDASSNENTSRKCSVSSADGVGADNEQDCENLDPFPLQDESDAIGNHKDQGSGMAADLHSAEECPVEILDLNVIDRTTSSLKNDEGSNDDSDNSIHSSQVTKFRETDCDGIFQDFTTLSVPGEEACDSSDNHDLLKTMPDNCPMPYETLDDFRLGQNDKKVLDIGVESLVEIPEPTSPVKMNSTPPSEMFHQNDKIFDIGVESLVEIPAPASPVKMNASLPSEVFHIHEEHTVRRRTKSLVETSYHYADEAGKEYLAGSDEELPKVQQRPRTSAFEQYKRPKSKIEICEQVEDIPDVVICDQALENIKDAVCHHPTSIIVSALNGCVGETSGIEDSDLKKNGCRLDVEALIPIHHRSFAVCCLPKMQVEIGEELNASFVKTAEEPFTVILQIVNGAESEEWRSAMINVNSRDSIEKLNVARFCEPDSVCLVSRPDYSCERGKIVQVDGELCTVELIDYGEMKTVHLSNLHELPEELSLYPRQSAICRLHRIGPVGDQESLDLKWSESIGPFLRQLLEGQTMSVEFLEIYESGGEMSYHVKLCLENDGESKKDVGDILVEAGMAQALKREEYNIADDEWTTMNESSWQDFLKSSGTAMQSSNMDLTVISDAFEEDLPLIPVKSNAKNDNPTVKQDPPPSEEQIISLAKSINSKAISDAVIITHFGCNDVVGFPSTKNISNTTQEVYIDLERIPDIIVKKQDIDDI